MWIPQKDLRLLLTKYFKQRKASLKILMLTWPHQFSKIIGHLRVFFHSCLKRSLSRQGFILKSFWIWLFSVVYKLIHKKTTWVFKKLHQLGLKGRENTKWRGFWIPKLLEAGAGLFNSYYFCTASDYLPPYSCGVFSFMCLKFSYFYLQMHFLIFNITGILRARCP